MFFDTHTHIDQADFDSDRGEVVERARQAGVADMVAVGTSAATSEKCVELARTLDGVYAAVGIQPNSAAEAEAGDWQRVVELAGEPKVVAIGETGLDRYWDFTPFELQQDYFDRHLRLAQQTGLPVVIHMRECGPDVVAMLRDARTRGPLSGVMHSFTGDAALADECLAMGMFLSFSGIVTYKKSDALRNCAVAVPADRLLVETDSPYLSPQAVRKVRRNEPAHVRHTAACLAEARGQSLEELARQTTENARRLFGLSGDSGG